MTLHPHISIRELDQYCALCHEHRTRTVKVDSETLQKIFKIAKSDQYQGIKFTQK
jgi:hypothetical protein